MSHEPAVTYEGALRILGRTDHKWLERLDNLLGGAILAAGVVTLGAPAAAAPVLKEVFGWTEQKNEALRLLRRMLDGLPGRLRGTVGLERRELVIAAHSAIVVAAYFEVLQETLGPERYKRLEITDDEKRRLANKAARHLYASEIPMPSASFGFSENQMRVADWLIVLHGHVSKFIAGLQAGAPEEAWEKEKSLLVRASERYDSFFLRLATEIPEFRTWVELNEHAATRGKLAEHDALFSTFQRQADALARVEDLFLAMRVTSDLTSIAGLTNRGALNAPIVPESATEHFDQNLVFPTIGQMFVNPRYRFCVTAPESRIEDETWWRQQPVADDLDLRLVAHLSSAGAAHQPLLVLGHPGAGKSMLTRVLAARLPASSFAVVRVPLRHVGAHAPVFDQIQQALDQATHQRVKWSELVEQSVNQVRVVILDGLDELLHMAQTGLYGYLRAVQEFQRRELEQGRPVVTIVTSRTVVTDRVDVPEGTPVVKLEEFDDGQISRWLDTWNDANAAGIRAGAVRAMPLEVALEQRDLTTQPLLLMMLAIYVADPRVPMPDERILPAELYDRLLTSFAEREAAKSREDLGPEEVRDDVERQLRHLSIAAFGMYNRGRQDISARELGADLAALERLPGNAAETGHRVLGRFFFVHVAEAQLAAPDSPDRRYEFLHATFGEYLVGRLVFEELAEVTRAVFSARRGMREPEDDLLFALLSSEPVSTRRPTLTFAKQICAGFAVADRERMAEVLTALIAGHRDRHGSDKFADYRPRAVDHVRELSAYTANLVLLRVVVDTRGSVPLGEVFREAPDPVQPWRSMLALWQAGLDGESWNGILSSLVNTAGHLELGGVAPLRENDKIHVAARLSGDQHLLAVTRYGLAFADNHLFGWAGDDWMEANNAWLAVALANQSSEILFLWMEPPEDADAEQLSQFQERVSMLLKTRAADMSTEEAEVFARHIAGSENPDSVALAAVVLAHPDLLDQFPDLDDPALFATPAAQLLFLVALNDMHESQLESLRRLQQQNSLGEIDERTITAVRELTAAMHWTHSTSRDHSYTFFNDVAFSSRGLGRKDDRPRHSRHLPSTP